MLNNITIDSIRDVFRTHSSFYGKFLSRKQLTGENHQLISQNNSILQVPLGCKYILNIELLLDRFETSTPGTSLKRQILRRPQYLRLERPGDVSLGDVDGGRPRDVLENNICQLGCCHAEEQKRHEQ